MRHLDGLTDNNIAKSGEANTFTKVVTQFVQFMADNRAADTLSEEANVIEEEDLEPTDTS